MQKQLSLKIDRLKCYNSLMTKKISLIFCTAVVIGIFLFIIQSIVNVERVIFIPSEGQLSIMSETDACPHEIHLKLRGDKILGIQTVPDYGKGKERHIILAPYKSIARITVADGSESHFSEIDAELVNFVYTEEGTPRRIDYRETISSDDSVCPGAWYEEVLPTGEENITAEELVGFTWQDAAEMGSGWSNVYVFFQDGTYLYRTNLMVCAQRDRGHAGQWNVSGGTLTLTPMVEYHHVGGEVVPDDTSCADGFTIHGGEEHAISIENSLPISLALHTCPAVEDLHTCISIGDTYFYNFEYQEEDFPKPTF
jgi:hypothetical protein